MKIQATIPSLISFLATGAQAGLVNRLHSVPETQALNPRTTTADTCPVPPMFFVVNYLALECANTQSIPNVLSKARFAQVGQCVQPPATGGDLVPSFMALNIAFDGLGSTTYVLHAYSGKGQGCKKSDDNKDTQIELSGGTGNTGCKNVIGGGYAYKICPKSGCP